jgi:DNA-binding IclR family transcriptional regulator
VFTLGVLQTLSETVQAPCYANVLAGDETVVIASAGARDGQAAMAARRRLVPPAGVVFMAWAAERRVNAWLDRIGAEDRERTRYRRVLATVRERGFSVTGDEGVRIRLEQAIAELGSASNGAVDVDYLATVMHDLTYKDYQLDHIDAGKPYSVWSLAVPVFDIYGSARMSFVITGLGTMTGAELMSAAGTAVASAAQATKLIAGLATPEEARSDAARRHELEPEYHTSA